MYQTDRVVIPGGRVNVHPLGIYICLNVGKSHVARPTRNPHQYESKPDRYTYTVVVL